MVSRAGKPGFLIYVTAQRLRAAILQMVQERGPGKSICPSDAAKAVDGENWRGLMEKTRDAARDLAKAGEVVVTQGDDVLDPDATWRGPIRIRAR